MVWQGGGKKTRNLGKWTSPGPSPPVLWWREPKIGPFFRCHTSQWSSSYTMRTTRIASSIRHLKSHYQKSKLCLHRWGKHNVCFGLLCFFSISILSTRQVAERPLHCSGGIICENLQQCGEFDLHNRRKCLLVSLGPPLSFAVLTLTSLVLPNDVPRCDSTWN